jgi:hypothetical protein
VAISFLVAVGLHQQAVEVVTDVLHGHGKLHLGDQALEFALAQAEAGFAGIAYRQQREVFRRQGLQVEAAFAGFQGEAAVQLFQRDGGFVRDGTQDVLQLLGRCGQAEVFARQFVGAGGGDLDFQIGGQEAYLSAFLSIRTLERIGRVWRRSTIPVTASRGLRRASRSACRISMFRAPECVQSQLSVESTYQLRSMESNVS